MVCGGSCGWFLKRRYEVEGMRGRKLICGMWEWSTWVGGGKVDRTGEFSVVEVLLVRLWCSIIVCASVVYLISG